jgi:hypothetical protein
MMHNRNIATLTHPLLESVKTFDSIRFVTLGVLSEIFVTESGAVSELAFFL